MSKIPLCLYAVPNPNKREGGSKTRVNKIGEAINNDDSNNTVIYGNGFKKLYKTLKASMIQTCYIESSTNRVKLVDIMCLIILKLKSEKMIVFIRDIYTILIPEEYQSFRKKITYLANKITNKFYIKISEELAFPTMQMGKLFCNEYQTGIEYFDLPPGTFKTNFFEEKSAEKKINNRTDKISFLYLGGTSYQNSGFKTYLNLAKKLGHKYKFHVLTKDNIGDLLQENDLENDVEVNSVSHDGVFKYINNKKISFLIHARPRNDYDDLTFPIKIMDCISVGLPIISLRHKPLVSLLNKEYPFFIPKLSAKNVENIIANEDVLAKNYGFTLNQFRRLKDLYSYSNQIKKLKN